MIHHLLRRGALALVLVAVCALTGCGRATREAPPKQLVHDAIAGALPPFLLLINLDQEPVVTSADTVKLNFKATVEAEEELFAVEREVDGLKKLTLLKRVQPAGGKCVLYGFLVAHRLIDQWTLESPQFQQSPAQLGKPRAAFGALAFVAGTAEAEVAVQRQLAANEQAQQKQQALAEQQERARLAREAAEAQEEKTRKERLEKARIEFEEQNQITAQQRQQTEAQRQQAAATARQQLIAATAAGTRYAGTKTGLNNSVQHLCVVFTEQKDTWLRAEVSDPDDAKAKRIFTGALRFNAEPERGSAVAYAIVLHGLPANKANPDRNSIFERAVTLKLRLTGQGLEGVADAGLTDQFPVRLERAIAASGVRAAAKVQEHGVLSPQESWADEIQELLKHVDLSITNHIAKWVEKLKAPEEKKRAEGSQNLFNCALISKALLTKDKTDAEILTACEHEVVVEIRLTLVATLDLLDHPAVPRILDELGKSDDFILRGGAKIIKEKRYLEPVVNENPSNNRRAP